MSWHSTGKSVVEQAAKVQEEQRKNKAPYRFKLKPNSSSTVIYLDDEGFSFQEHSIQHGQKWEQWTCSGPSTCPLCQSGNKPYHITVFSVIDTTRWTDQRGQLHQNEKKIHALKADSALALMNKKERWGGLKGKAVLISRKGDKDAGAGSDFELMLKDGRPVAYKIDNTKPEHQPFNYAGIYEPKSPDFIKTALGMNVQSSFAAATQHSAPSSSESAMPAFEILDPMDMDGEETKEESNDCPF